LVEQIAARVGQVLEKRGLIERDIENAWLAAGAEPGPLDDLIGHSITYRIAVGPRAGQKLFTLRWAQCKYRKLAGKPTRAREWLAKVVGRQPRLFVYWFAHGRVAVRTMG
jgi:hypothetical protein